MATKKLQKELLELSKEVDKFSKLDIHSDIILSIELSDDFTLPITFKCEALHPGIYKGFTIREEEIVKAKNTIFEQNGNYYNYEINKDHKGNKKEGSSVDDVIGKVTHSNYDYDRQSYILSGEIYDRSLALKIINKLVKFVSLRINPGKIDLIDGETVISDLKFEELSFVRIPGDSYARVFEINNE